MTVTINIPQEFEEHYTRDRFEDSLERIRADIKYALEASLIRLAGNYELELIEMLRDAFKEVEYNG